jgi:hypothetical protein
MPQDSKSKPQQSWADSFLKPLFDVIGLNGAGPLQASRTPQETQKVRVTADLLRNNGWSEKDIQWWIKTHPNGQ